MSESQQQAAVVQYFKTKWPNEIIYASANGAHIAGTKQQRINKVSRMKREGMLPGVPDLCIAVARAQFHGPYIEMKDVGKKWSDVSKAQREILTKLNKSGCHATWAPGATAAIEYIDKYMSLPLPIVIGIDIAKGRGFKSMKGNK